MSNPKLLPNRVLVIAANQSTVKLTTHSACYQTQSPRCFGSGVVSVCNMCMCPQTALQMNNMREDAITGHGVRKCTGCKPVLRLCVSIWIYVGGLLFSFLFFSQKERTETDSGQQSTSSLWSVPQLLNSSITTSLSRHVMAGQVHLICTVQDHDRGAEREEFYLAGCEYFTVKEKNKLVIFVYSERKHGVRESSSQKFTQYRKLLAMRKKNVFFFFLFLECWFHCVNCQSEWISLCQTSFSWFFFFFSCGNSWKCMTGPSVSSAVCLSEGHRELRFLMMSKNLNDKDDIHTVLRTSSHLLNPSLFSFFFVLCFFCCPFKG